MPPSNASSTQATTTPLSAPETRTAHTCAIHQPNLFPRLSTLAKLYAADVRIVLDDVQFCRRDYQHRARLATLRDPTIHQWLSMPTHLPGGQATLISAARIADPQLCRRRIRLLIEQYYRRSPHWRTVLEVLEPVLDILKRTDRTAVVTEASTATLLSVVGWSGQVLYSSDIPSGHGRSERLADLATVAGADAYLCGTGGMRYLEHGQFTNRNIAVIPFKTPDTGIWAHARQVTTLWALATIGPTALTAELESARQSEALPQQRGSRP